MKFFKKVLTLLDSCNSNATIKENDKYGYDYLIGKPIKGYNLLQSYGDTSIRCDCVTYPLILNYVETNCPSCVLELKKWSDFFQENKVLMSKVDFIVIAAG